MTRNKSHTGKSHHYQVQVETKAITNKDNSKVNTSKHKHYEKIQTIQA